MRTTSFDTFRASIVERMGSVETNVLVARAPAEDDEDYWLAKAVCAPWRTPEDATIGLDEGLCRRERGWSKFSGTSAWPPRRPRRVPARSHLNQFPLVVRSLVAVSNRNGVTFDKVHGSVGTDEAYVISTETHESIMRYGNWDHGWARDWACCVVSLHTDVPYQPLHTSQCPVLLPATAGAGR